VRETVAHPNSPGLLRRMARHWADYCYVMPAVGVMLLVIGYPVYCTVYLSFFSTPSNLALDDKIFVGLDNYLRILGAESVQEATVNTLIWTVGSTQFSFVIGFAAALALNGTFPGRGLLRGILLIPYVISAVAASYVWRWLLHSDFGVFGAVSMAAGVTDHSINFLDNTTTVCCLR
jgi:multiple sugar transport system permease protein